MSLTVLYSENVYPDDSVERCIYGPDVQVLSLIHISEPTRP